MTIYTENEKAVLVSLYNCHYGEYGDWVWSWAHNDSTKPHNLSKSTVAGVLGSLTKKGLVWSQNNRGDDDYLGLTKAGQEAAKELDAAR